MNHALTTLIKAILAGILIAIAGTIYLSLENKLFGAFLFGFGLLVILINHYNLYTSKVAYIIDNKTCYLSDIALIILGNFVGTFMVAKGIQLAELTTVISAAQALVTYKSALSLKAAFVLSIFCGMMMYLAADGYKHNQNDVAKVAVVFCAVIIFILAKFEHSIANMYYFSVANAWSSNTLVALIIMIAGNGVGALILNGLEKMVRHYEQSPKHA